MSRVVIAPCSRKAAEYAVRKWHYTRALPAGPCSMIGVWDNEIFSGVIIFGTGTCKNLVRTFGLEQYEGCELVRIAFRDRAERSFQASSVVSKAVRLQRKVSPNIKLMVSYADPVQNHHGGIYQAMSWVYIGKSMGTKQYFFRGEWRHNRVFQMLYAEANKAGREDIKEWIKRIPTRKVPTKHKYILPCTKNLRKVCLAMAKPYPKPNMDILDV